MAKVKDGSKTNKSAANGKANKKVISTEVLVSIAEELNDVLGLDPEIDTEQDAAALKATIIEAAELLEEGDELSSGTRKALEQLRHDAPVSDNVQDETAATVQDASEDPPTNDEPPAETAAEPVQDTEVGSSTNDAPHAETAAQQPAKRRVAKVMTRQQALAKSLRETNGKTFTTAEIIKTSSEHYRTANGMADDAGNGAKAEWSVVKAILMALGLVEKVGDSNTLRFVQ